MLEINHLTQTLPPPACLAWKGLYLVALEGNTATTSTAAATASGLQVLPPSSAAGAAPLVAFV